MQLDDYQVSAFSTAVYDRKGENLEYVGLGLGGEVGEVLEIFKRVTGRGEELDNRKLLLELGDVLWYIAGVVTECGQRLSEVMGHQTFAAFQLEVSRTWITRLPVGTLCLILESMAGKVADDILLTIHPERSVDKRADILVQLKRGLQCLTAIGQVNGLTLNDIARFNLQKLGERVIKGTLKGFGSDR